jgi:hypothetical protein
MEALLGDVKREDADVHTPLRASAGEAEVEQCIASAYGTCGVCGQRRPRNSHIIPPKIFVAAATVP